MIESFIDEHLIFLLNKKLGPLPEKPLRFVGCSIVGVCDAYFLATSRILLFGADKMANNMSTNDDCYLGACSLIKFKRLAVSNENAAKSIVLHFRSPTRPSLNDRLSHFHNCTFLAVSHYDASHCLKFAKRTS